MQAGNCSSGTSQGLKLRQIKEGTCLQQRQHSRALCSAHSCSCKANKMFSCIWKGTANNPGNIITPLYKSVAQPQMGRKVMMQKRQEVFNQYLCSAFEKKQDEMPVSHEEDEVLSSPLVTKEVVKQHLLAINNFKSAGLDNLLPRALKQLAEKLSGPLILIFNRSWNTGKDLDSWEYANTAVIC